VERFLFCGRGVALPLRLLRVPQIEYGDFYKFVVSLGIALLLASIVTPWLFLREPFDLTTEATRLALLTPVAQKIISDRQAILVQLLPIVPWASLSFAIVGISFIATGLTKWRNRQLLRDKAEDLALEKLKKELSNMSAEEVNERAVADLEQTSPAVFGAVELESAATKVLAIERSFYERLRKCFDQPYRLLVNQRLGIAEYDAILQSIDRSEPDIIIEMKYIRQGFKYSWLSESVRRLAVAKDLYTGSLGRAALPVLCVIFAQEDVSARLGLQEIRERVQSEMLERGAKIRVEYILEASVSGMSCEDVRRLILG
jgi:hypothetical protein